MKAKKYNSVLTGRARISKPGIDAPSEFYLKPIMNQVDGEGEPSSVLQKAPFKKLCEPAIRIQAEKSNQRKNDFVLDVGHEHFKAVPQATREGRASCSFRSKSLHLIK